MNLNQEFDVLMFEKNDDSSESIHFTCYKEVISSKNWTKECGFVADPSRAGVTMLLNQQHFDVVVKSLSDSNNIDRHVVIDNSPFPPNGALRKCS